MNKFRLLNADEIECRIQNITEKGLSLLLYKTARTDADLLDETVGAENWQNDFKLVDGVLYGGICIDGVWKWDAGTESNTEAEKGRASDAFKRAGFKWGIGRELYSAPFIWINADKCSIKKDGNRLKCYDKFEVATMRYEKNKICALMITNTTTGKFVYQLGGKNDVPPKEEPKEEPITVTAGEEHCEICGNLITEYKGVPAMKWATISAAKHGQKMCAKCFNERREKNA